MGIEILLDPGVDDGAGRRGGGTLPGPRPAPADERSPGFRDMERLVLTEFARLAAVHEKARGQAAGDTIEPGLAGESPIALDRTLLAGLCLRYVTHGWPGIASAQDKLMARANHSGTVTGDDVKFFCATRGLVRMLVSRTLVDLEEHATRLVLEGEAACSREVERTWTLLELKSPQEQPQHARGKSGAQSLTGPDTYKAENTDLVRDLHRSLHAIADVLRGVAEAVRAKEYLSGSRAGNDATDANFDRIAAETANIAAELTKSELFAKECPLGLLGMRLTTRFTTRDDLAHKLGVVLDRMRAALARLRASEPGGRSEQVVGDPATYAPDAYDLTGGPELGLINRAFTGMTKEDEQGNTDKGWLPLVHQATWARMVREGGLPEGGWGLAVAEHYLRALNERREADAQEAKANALFWQRIDKVASGLSLLAFIAAPIGGVVLTIAARTLFAASVALMVHQVTAAVEAASLADETLLSGVAVSGPEAVGADVLSELGEAAWVRHTVYGETFAAMTIAMLAQFAGARLPILREALEHYSYLQDILTITEPRHGEGNGHTETGDATEGEAR